MAFVKITEQPSLYDNLEKKIGIGNIARYQYRRPESRFGREKSDSSNRKTGISNRSPHETRRTHFLYGSRNQRASRSTRRFGNSPTFGMPPTLVIGLIAGGDTALRNPVENAEDDMNRGWEELKEHNINEKDTVIGIAASGTTPYVIGALHAAREHGILTGSISSNPDSPISKEADVAIEMIVGPEYVTGSSRMKSGTGQKMILNMITTSVMIQLGRVKGNRMVNMQLSNQKLVDRGTRMVSEELGMDYDQAKRLLLLHGSVKKSSRCLPHRKS